MISRHSGDLRFSNGLCVLAQLPLEAMTTTGIVAGTDSRGLPLNGWNYHLLGIHPSEHGSFEVAVVTDANDRVQIAFLSHCHAFYEEDTPDDSERRAFHQGVLDADLAGQREFRWGEAFCRLDPEANKDWLIVSYAQGPCIPLDPAAVLLHLAESESEKPGWIDRS